MGHTDYIDVKWMVTGKKTVSISGQNVEVWRIEEEFGSAGVGQTERVYEYSPELGFPVSVREKVIAYGRWFSKGLGSFTLVALPQSSLASN